MKTWFAKMFGLLVLMGAVTAFQEPVPKPAGDGKVSSKPVQEKTARAFRTYSSFDLPEPGEPLQPPGTVALLEADVATVFALYESLSQRSVIPGINLPNPKLSYRIDKALPRSELLQALDTLLVQNGIMMIYMGTNFVKAVTENFASREAAPEISGPPASLPDSNSYMQYSFRLQHRAVNDAVPLIQPFCRLPNSVLTVPSNNTVVIRDYSANVRRILKMLQDFDVPESGEVFGEPGSRPRRK